MKKFISRLTTLLLTTLLCLNALPVFAANGSNGDAVYRDGVVGGYNHAAILKYNSSGSNYVYEATGSGPITYDSWSVFLNGNNTYLGAFYNPSTQPAGPIVSMAAALQAIPSIRYNLNGQLAYDSTAGTNITPEHITTLRCDGLVEYCYEYNYSKVWTLNLHPTQWDISVKANVADHFVLGLYGGSSVSPYVQRGGNGTEWTTLRQR